MLGVLLLFIYFDLCLQSTVCLLDWNDLGSRLDKFDQSESEHLGVSNHVINSSTNSRR